MTQANIENMNKNLYAVILAGGSGTRFWPLSRKSAPKQFLNILGEKTLFQETIARILPVVPKANILIVTNAGYLKTVKKQIAGTGIRVSNILLEPVGKNTAPAIGWAASRVKQLNPNGVMMVLPSDHLILNKKDFLKNMDQAVRLAGAGYLVTLGIIPTRPETGYGYLKTLKKNIHGDIIYIVQRFIEKPDLNTAQKYIKDKAFLWNAGMFIWRADVILKEFQKYLPTIHDAFKTKTDLACARAAWPKLPAISIDYGILEKADNIAAIPAGGMGWSDVGSWEALWEALPKNRNGNSLKGYVLDLGSKNSILWSEGQFMATIGLDDVVVINTPNALLVCRKDMSQKIRDVVEFLKKNEQDKLIS